MTDTTRDAGPQEGATAPEQADRGEAPSSTRRGPLTAAGSLAGTLLSELFGVLGRGLDRGIERIEYWLVDARHARYGLAITRILLGLTGLGLLITNFRTRYYAFGSGSAWNGEAAQPVSDFPQIWIFSLFHRLALHDGWFTLACLVLGALAVLVILGWRTKIVLPIFFVGWVSFIEVNDALGDQGDNMYRITLLALLFADTAGRWSLDARRRGRGQALRGPWWKRAWHGGEFAPAWLTNTLHNLALVAVATHVCFVYASGALYKAGGAAWQHGYAIYNPLQTQRFGPWPELSDLFTTWGPMVAVISWTSIILQMSFPMMLMRRPTRIIALFGICGFHIGIAVLMGLPWFSLAMIAIDAIFVRDVTWARLAGRIGDGWRQARAGDRGDPDGDDTPERGATPATEESEQAREVAAPDEAPEPAR
ncbi:MULTISPECIES: HTTM domain-containing protein [unclassified Pseudactinotalea]|uniref:HTTM domain-containing protein n=1 Tax=unclassified Pseudactinotalea TaxID=2649176 RepID=UPI00128CAFDD|nr:MULTISPECIES: HTTM domain-containing protein [unclassified Pseudactinotalea]MPV49506.1 HTTM domain-containing protein [Pseudactinotalea sp. HY160]QGH69819.1 HTTM domain-containing protein [Pseudactinotalea sp. HY158]